MAEEIRHPDGRIEHPSVRTEKTDASFRAVLVVILVAMFLAAVLHWAVWEFFVHRRAHEDRVRRSPFPLAPTPSRALPPQPRLEQVQRMGEVGREKSSLTLLPGQAGLRSYPQATEKGFTNIPIERAIDLLADRLPSRGGQGVVLDRSVVAGTGLGLLGAGQGQGPFLAAATLLEGKTDMPRRDAGLVDAGGPNSGRMFRRTAPWQER